MKAIVYHDYGSTDVLLLEEVEKPVPRDDEVLIEVRAASVNPLDSHLMRGRPFIGRLFFGVRKPKDGRPGRDVAGVVEAVGGNVTLFKPGEEVFGSCRGAFAEYACASESAVVTKPVGVSFEQAASVPVAAYTALQALRDKGRVEECQRVLINGAAGGVGTFAVQIGKWLGAEVTGVCSARNAEMVQSIGADHVIDYGREDFASASQRYDVIFDLVGNHSVLAYRRVLNREGTYIGAGVLGVRGALALFAHLLAPPLLSWFVSQRFFTFMARRSREDLAIMGDLIAAGTVTPVIDRCYTLNDVPAAIRYVEQGHARGKVVITLGHGRTA